MLLRRIFILLYLLTSIARAEDIQLSVDIRGLDGTLLDNARALLSLEQYRKEGSVTALRIKRLHKRAPQELALALQPYGYYNANIDARLEHDDTQWHARYDITPGPQAQWRQIDIELQGAGSDSRALQRSIRKSPLQPGVAVSHSEYDSFKKTLLQTAQARGYLDARFTDSRLLILEGGLQADVMLRFDTGPQYFLGSVSFVGSDLKQDLLVDYIPFDEGDVFSYQQLQQLQRALENSDYFDHVEVIPERDAAIERHIPISVKLTPHRPNRYSVGLGFGTDTGPRARVGWENRQLNTHGHKLETDYRVSTIKSAFNALYRIPLERAHTDFLQFDASFGREDTDNVESRFRSVAAKYSIWHSVWRKTLSLTHRQEDFELGLTSGDTVLLIPAVTFSRIWGSDRLVVNNGARVQLELSGASTALLSEATFVRVSLDSKLIHSPWHKGRILLRGQLGITESTEFDQLPPSIRFFAGGDHSVRGYEYQSLGPRDASGEVVGARYLLTGSIEYEHRIQGDWRGAVFLDVGNAINDVNDPLEQGVGFGVRYRSPIGLIRLDIANAISEPDNPWRLHLTLGPDL